VWVFDVESGQVSRKLTGHVNSVRAVCFGARIIASGGDDRTVHVFDAIDGRCTHTFQGHTDSVTGVSVVQDDSILSSSTDETILLWSTPENGEPEIVEHFRKPHHAACCVVAMPGPAKRFASASADDKTCLVWNMTGMRHDTKYAEMLHLQKVTCAHVSGSRAATGSVDRTARVWDIETGRLVSTLQHTETVYSVAIARDRVVTGVLLETKLWDADTGLPIRLFRGHTDVVFAVAISRDCTRVASLSYDGMKMWNAQSGDALADGDRSGFDGMDDADLEDDRFVSAWTSTGVGFTPDLRAEDLKRIGRAVFGPAGNAFSLWYL
jgi:WD40 repeat protein